MIPAVDEALRRVVRESAVHDDSVGLTFDAPTRDWAARRTSPTISLYLYDLHEVVSRREFGRLPVEEQGRVVSRAQPQRWYRLSYLLTCWTARAEDEHAMLGECLVGLLRHQVLPAEWLGDATGGLPCKLEVALPPPTDRKTPDLWSALGGQLKPSLDLQVTVALSVGRAEDAGPPVTAPPALVVAPRGKGAGGRERRTSRTPVAAAPAREPES